MCASASRLYRAVQLLLMYNEERRAHGYEPIEAECVLFARDGSEELTHQSVAPPPLDGTAEAASSAAEEPAGAAKSALVRSPTDGRPALDQQFGSSAWLLWEPDGETRSALQRQITRSIQASRTSLDLPRTSLDLPRTSLDLPRTSQMAAVSAGAGDAISTPVLSPLTEMSADGHAPAEQPAASVDAAPPTAPPPSTARPALPAALQELLEELEQPPEAVSEAILQFLAGLPAERLAHLATLYRMGALQPTDPISRQQRYVTAVANAPGNIKAGAETIKGKASRAK